MTPFVLTYRYRHYGVYRTKESDQLMDNGCNGGNTSGGNTEEDEEATILRNAVVVILDKNAESYVNLKYPVNELNGDDLELHA